MVGVVGVVEHFLAKRRRKQNEKHTWNGWNLLHHSHHSHHSNQIRPVFCVWSVCAKGTSRPAPLRVIRPSVFRLCELTGLRQRINGMTL